MRRRNPNGQAQAGTPPRIASHRPSRRFTLTRRLDIVPPTVRHWAAILDVCSVGFLRAATYRAISSDISKQL
ncbi:hypothetical protein PVAP13_1KG187454 [Panicum virgatum]|uniref:Uncharacterized protein n=1 Tax=Panicum virgatum TaxID=38727 RepID=A0A8T0XCT2_PANVG|nr:hypothetical protein PVAP13_1KG187454 [Panicum virgatum]